MGELHYPGSALAANALWLVFALACFATAVFGPEGDWGVGRYLLGGVSLLMALLIAASAVRTRTYRLRFDDQKIVVSSFYGTQEIPYRDVAKVVLYDSRRNREELESGRDNRPGERPLQHIDIKTWDLYDRSGKRLLVINADLEPHAQLRALLQKVTPAR